MAVSLSVGSELRDNPFYALGVSCSADRRVITAAEAKNGAQQTAHGHILLDPAARLTAELNWFPDVDDRVISQIRQYIQTNQKIPAGVGSTLAALNVEIYNLGLLRGARGWDPVGFEKTVSAIDRLFSALDEAQLAHIINQHRRQAGIPEVTSQQVTQELVNKRRQIRHLMRDLMNAMPGMVRMGMVTYLAEKNLGEKGNNPGAVLTDAISLYEQGAQANLDQTYRKITEKINSIKQLSGRALDKSVEELLTAASQWVEMAKPMLLRFRAGGNRYLAADTLAGDLRILFIFLHNEKQETEAALKLAEGAKKLFAYDSTFRRKVEEDIHALKKVADQKESLGNLQKELEQVLTTATSATSRKWSASEAIPMTRDLMFTVFLVNRKLKKIAKEEAQANQLRELLALAARSVAVELHNKSSMTQLAYDMLCCIVTDFSDVEAVKRKISLETTTLMMQLEAMKKRGMWYNRDTLPLAQMISLADDVCQLRERRLYRGDRNFAETCLHMARIYENGEGTARNPEKAKIYYTMGSDAGNAQCSIGAAMLLDQNTDPKSKFEAHKRYTLAVQQGTTDNRVFSSLGVLYMNGTGIGKDYVKAGEMFRRAGDQENLALLEQRIKADKAAASKKKHKRAVAWLVALVVLAVATVGGLYAMHERGMAAYESGDYQTAVSFLMLSPFDDTVYEYCAGVTELQKAISAKNPAQYLERAKSYLATDPQRQNARKYLDILACIEQKDYDKAIGLIEALPAEQGDELGTGSWKQILRGVLEATEATGLEEKLEQQYLIKYLQDPVPYDSSAFIDILDISRSAIGKLPENDEETAVPSLEHTFMNYGKKPQGKILIVKQSREYENATPYCAVSFDLMKHLPLEYTPRTVDEVAYVIVVSYSYQRDPEGRYMGTTAALQETAVVKIFSTVKKQEIYTSDTIYGANAPYSFTYQNVPPKYMSGGRPKAGKAFVTALETLIK